MCVPANGLAFAFSPAPAKKLTNKHSNTTLRPAISLRTPKTDGNRLCVRRRRRSNRKKRSHECFAKPFCARSTPFSFGTPFGGPKGKSPRCCYGSFRNGLMIIHVVLVRPRRAAQNCTPFTTHSASLFIGLIVMRVSVYRYDDDRTRIALPRCNNILRYSRRCGADAHHIRPRAERWFGFCVYNVLRSIARVGPFLGGRS